jgi:hypothetical protein
VEFLSKNRKIPLVFPYKNNTKGLMIKHYFSYSLHSLL